MLKALYIILTSLGLALIFNFLFFGNLIGISVLIFVTILLGAILAFGRNQRLSFQKSGWLSLPILFFALMLAIRANEFLSFLNVCAILGLLILFAHGLVGTPAFLMRFRDYLVLIVLVPFRMLLKALSTVTQIGQIHSDIKQHDLWIRIFKGVIMAVPVLIIFGILFSQADLAFSKFLQSFINISISERTAQYFFLLFIVFVAALSFLSYIFSSKQVEADRQPDPVVTGRGVEVMVFLGLIATLFLIFIGFQITYLFGGESNIVNAGFTYAEYARRGFFELLAVAILSLLVLVVSEKYAGSESKRDNRFLIPSLILITEVGIVIISAFKRLDLYIDAYSMTLQRFYVAGFIILLLVLFVLLAIKFIKAKPEHFFTFGTLLSVVSFLVIVNLVNPDAFIAKSNLKQYEQTGKIDIAHVGQLSADAEVWKIDLYKKLEGEEKKVLGELLQKQKDELQKFSEDWQSANLSRAKASKMLQDLF